MRSSTVKRVNKRRNSINGPLEALPVLLPEERTEPLPHEKPIDLATLAMNHGKSYRTLMRYVGPNRKLEPELWADKFGQSWQTYMSWVRIWQKKLASMPRAMPVKKPPARGVHTR